MREALVALLFPTPPRQFPGRRLVKIVLRAIHVVFVCGLIGAALHTDPIGSPWWLGTAVSGMALLLLDLVGSAVFVVQLRGLVVLLKIAVFAALPVLGESAAAVLIAVVFVSVISSHAPSGFRYFMLLGRDRLTPSEDKG